MPDPKRYFEEVKSIQKKLIDKHGDVPFVWITSIENFDKGSADGGVCQAPTYVAARAIRDRTHRESTEEEVDGFRNLQKKNLKESQKKELDRKTKTVVHVVQGPADSPVESAAAPGPPPPQSTGVLGTLKKGSTQATA
jgi:hypothetical protein